MCETNFQAASMASGRAVCSGFTHADRPPDSANWVIGHYALHPAVYSETPLSPAIKNMKPPRRKRGWQTKRKPVKVVRGPKGRKLGKIIGWD